MAEKNKKCSTIQSNEAGKRIGKSEEGKGCCDVPVKVERERSGKTDCCQKEERQDLQNAITAIVKREIEAAKVKAKAEAEAKRKADELAKKNAPASNPATNPAAPTAPAATTTTSISKRNVKNEAPASYLDLNAKDVALNASFQANKAKLPWPVDNGIVTLRFGRNKVGDYIDIDNPGLTIATPTVGVTVKTVFDGEVSGIYNLGDGMAVTIRHGKYFTTYGNLSTVSVSKGSVVKTGQAIGRAGKDDDGNGGQIDFILMIETRNVDPYPWLRR
ncbi:MAG: peptidoglycan DD-metalloendopeptidase family protein [Chitinophagaceae bacterium]|nr:peptidoglycan DD-metalloendopeptidase family protein [Chitinophagaceae bacterium]